MTTKTNFTSPSRWQVSALALLATTVTLLAFTPLSTNAGDQVPFKGSFNTDVEMVLEFPYLHVFVTGQGNASHLGATTAVSTDQLVNVIDGSATATYTLTGANGDTVILAMVFQGTNIPGGVTFEGTYLVGGGTGRFAGAAGSGTLEGSAVFFDESTGAGFFSVAGMISSPGSLK
jgi:hypothetical protein